MNENEISANWGSIVFIRESQVVNREISSSWGSTIIVIPDDYEYNDTRLDKVMDVAIQNSRTYHAHK